MVRWYKIGKYWSMGNGKYGYIDEQGNRGIADSKSEARRKSGGKRSKSPKGGGSMSGKNLKLLPLIGATGGASSDYFVQRGINDGNLKDVAFGTLRSFTGVDPYNQDFDWKNMKGLGGLALGAIGSKIASKTGINRYLPKGINL